MRTNALKEDVQTDPFLQRGRATAAWLGRRTHILRLGLLSGVLIVVSLAWVNKTQRRNAERASIAFAQGVTFLSDANASRQSSERGSNDSQNLSEQLDAQAPLAQKKRTGDSRELERAADAFEKAIRLVGTRGVGAMATVLLAETDLRRGRQDSARARLQLLLREIRPDRSPYFLAAQSLSALEESAHDFDAAAAPFRVLAEERSRPYADWAAWSLARLAFMRGDTLDAKERLDRLEIEFSQTALADDVARLRARLSRPIAEKASS